jgi:anti-sigma regulatory factor (Ser/Thr protein kinase)
MNFSPDLGVFAHEALFYRDPADYLAVTVPFVADGRAAGEPVLVAVPPANGERLRCALGAGTAGVRFADMTSAGRNPGRIIPWVLLAFAAEHPGRRVRIIGEPIWPGRTDTEYPACVQHEALINPAFADRPATILCPYDVTGLDPAVLADARATHPVLVDAAGRSRSEAYAGADPVVAAHNRPLPPPPAHAVELAYGAGRLVALRRLVSEFAATAGLGPDRGADLLLAVNEVAANTIRHTGGPGVLRIWRDGGAVVCELRDSGWLRDPLAGRRPVPPDGEHERGLRLVNYLCDLVRTHTGAAGTTTRLYLGPAGN